MWTIDPQIPLPLWWALALAGTAAITFYALRKQWPVSMGRRVVLVMLLGVGLMGPLLIALNPTWVETIPPMPGNPLLTVLLDGTQSMSTTDVGTQSITSRWQRAVELASQVKPGNRSSLQASDISIDVRHLAFADNVQALSAVDLASASDKQTTKTPAITANSISLSTDDDAQVWPRGHRSDLSMALRNVMRTGSPVGHAILMIGDGAHNVGSVESVMQAAREANALSTPIYTITLGTSIGMKNLSLTARSPRMIAFPNNPVTIRASVAHSGLAGQVTEVTLLKDDQVIDSQRIKLSADAVQEVRFTLSKGVNDPIQRFRIAATEVTGEVTTADNQTTVVIQRLSHPIGVLILEGKPYWDSKFLARNMALDPVVELSTIVRMSSDRYLLRKVQHTNNLDAVPNGNGTDEVTGESWSVEQALKSPLESPELLEKYRLVILGRDAGAFLTEQATDNLRNWISKSGGCLLCARGAPTDQVSSMLAELLPVRWTPGIESRFRAKVSPLGLDSSIFDPLLSDGSDPLNTLPSLAVNATPKQRAGLPQVLMQSTEGQGDETVPIVTYQPFGSGQTIVVEGAGMWRWAFLPPQHADKDKIYPTLWQSMVQWIISQQDVMPGQEVAIRSDRATFLTGERATASVTLRNPAQWLSAGGVQSLSVTMQSPGESLPKRFSLIPSAGDASLFRVDLGSLGVGFYTLKVVRGETDQVMAASAFEVRDPWFESLEVDARPDLMSRVARLSGGAVIQPDKVADLLKAYEERIRSQRTHEEIRTSLWDRPLVLMLILGCWIVTWIVRRQSGLV